jgi:hypothetical protein
MSDRRSFSWNTRGRERWISALGGRREGEGEREDEHDKQSGPFVRGQRE